MFRSGVPRRRFEFCLYGVEHLGDDERVMRFDTWQDLKRDGGCALRICRRLERESTGAQAGQQSGGVILPATTEFAVYGRKDTLCGDGRGAGHPQIHDGHRFASRTQAARGFMNRRRLSKSPVAVHEEPRRRIAERVGNAT